METRLAVTDDAFQLAALHEECFGPARWNVTQFADSLTQAVTRCWIAFDERHEKKSPQERQNPLPLAGLDAEKEKRPVDVFPASRPKAGREGGAKQKKYPAGFILCKYAGDEAEILTFCVAAAARRQGIAQHLLAKAIAEARHEKRHLFFLEVAVDNAAALSLYEKAGFKKTGIRKNYYKRDGKAIDAVMLTLEL